jgi:tetratricopeptide (TPR) repeat protein
MFSRLFNLLRVILPVILLAGLDIWPIPKAVSVNLTLARAAERSGRPAHAAAALARVAEQQPYRFLEEQIAFALVRAGEFEQADGMFAAADQRNHLSPAGLESWAAVAEQTGRNEEALRLWARVSQGATGAEGFRRITLLLRMQGDYPGALESARKWQTLAPGNAQAVYLVGLLLAADSPQEAGHWIELAASLDPAYQPTVLSFRTAMGQAGLSDDPAYRLTVMGRWLGGLGDWDLAEDAFARAVATAPEYAEAWAFLGQSRSELGKGGLIELEQAVQIAPQSILSRALLASYYAGQGDFETALIHMRAAGQLEPDRAVWQVELGNYSAASGSIPDALNYFTAARELEPENPLVWEATASFSLTYSVDMHTLGLPAARHLIWLRPDQALGYDLAGAIMLSQGDLRSAERFLQRALEVESDYALAHYHLGQVYLQLSQMEKARYHLRKAVEFDLIGGTAQAAQRLLKRYLGEG